MYISDGSIYKFLSDTYSHGESKKDHGATKKNLKTQDKKINYFRTRAFRLDSIQGKIQGICKYHTRRRKRTNIIEKENRKKYT